MRIRPGDSGYLQKGSGISWADCLAATPSTNGDLSDIDYLYIGKRYYVAGGPTQNWRLWQTFLRFDLAVIPDSHSITSATLRLYLATDGTDTNVTVQAHVLAATYGTLAAVDWDAAAAQTATLSTSAVATDSDGRLYFDIPFTAAMLALMTTTATVFDLRLDISDETTAPTAGEYLKAYGGSYATATLRPNLYVETASKREQILEALVTTLDGIDEYAGYATTPKVSRVLQPIPILKDESQYPLIAVVGQMDTYPHTVSQADDCDWKIIVAAGVYCKTRASLATRIEELVDDVRRCLAANDRLGLDSSIMHMVMVEDVQTDEDYIIDNNRAFALLTLAVQYRQLLDET